jgi:hypothetical protein
MGQRGKTHEVLESAKGSFAAALRGKAVLPRKGGTTACMKRYYRSSGTTACDERYYRSSGTTARKRYYRLEAILLGFELDSFLADNTDLVRAKPTLWRFFFQV